MAILKNLVSNAGIISGSLGLRVSGEITVGEHRAVNGDGAAKSLGLGYKEVLYISNGYSCITLPIQVDNAVKGTRAVVIRILKDNYGRCHLPGFIQFYDPDNWISSNVTKTNPLNIYVVQQDMSRTTGSSVSSGMYLGLSVSYKILVSTSSSTLTTNTTPLATYTVDSSNPSILMANFKFTKNSEGEWAMTANFYDNLSDVVDAGLVKYLV